MSTTHPKTALLAGATGLVGGEVLRLLLASGDYAKVVAFVRRPIPHLSHPKLEQVIVDFDDLAPHAQHFQGADVYCCLGTTIKIAKTREAFRKVDFDYPLRLAELAKQNGARQYLIITALGSDAKSSVFYNRVKGEVELSLRALDLPALRIFRPSLLLGERNEFRFGEKVASFFSFAIVGPLKKYRPIHARTVARALLHVALHDTSVGTRVYESNEMEKLATAPI